jgi:hypothetical protein
LPPFYAKKVAPKGRTLRRRVGLAAVFAKPTSWDLAQTALYGIRLAADGCGRIIVNHIQWVEVCICRFSGPNSKTGKFKSVLTNRPTLGVCTALFF